MITELREAYRKECRNSRHGCRMKEATSALRVALMSAKTAIRRNSLQEAVQAQENSHVETIKQLQESTAKPKMIIEM